MDFPIVLSDKFELEQFVASVAKRTATQVLLQTGQIKPMMKVAECYRLSSRRMVDNAIRKGLLKCVKKDNNILVRRDDFDNWISNHDFFINNK